jgi:hypothetical protein
LFLAREEYHGRRPGISVNDLDSNYCLLNISQVADGRVGPTETPRFSILLNEEVNVGQHISRFSHVTRSSSYSPAYLPPVPSTAAVCLFSRDAGVRQSYHEVSSRASVSQDVGIDT